MTRLELLPFNKERAARHKLFFSWWTRSKKRYFTHSTISQAKWFRNWQPHTCSKHQHIRTNLKLLFHRSRTKNKYKKVLPLRALGNLCLTWHQKHAVRFLTWQHQLWSFIEKIYAALKVRIWQLTGTRLSTVLPCLDIVENYVHTMWKPCILLVARGYSEYVTVNVAFVKFAVSGLTFLYLGMHKLWIITEDWDAASRSVK